MTEKEYYYNADFTENEKYILEFAFKMLQEMFSNFEVLSKQGYESITKNDLYYLAKKLGVEYY